MNYETSVIVYDATQDGDPRLRMEMVRRAILYSQIRVEWQMAPIGDRMAMNSRRTAAHNALIDAVNALARSMRAAGRDDAWRRLLTDDRKEIGDFACFLVAHLGVLAR